MTRPLAVLFAVAVLAVAGCGGKSSDGTVVTIPDKAYSDRCVDLSDAYYSAVGDRLGAEYGTAAYRKVERRIADAEDQLRAEGCWP